MIAIQTIRKQSDSNGTLGVHYGGGICLRRYCYSRKLCSSLVFFLKRHLFNVANYISKSGVCFSIIAVRQVRKFAQRDGVDWGGGAEIEVKVIWFASLMIKYLKCELIEISFKCKMIKQNFDEIVVISSKRRIGSTID